MNIIICGDGQVGIYLAHWLTKLGHSITVLGPRSEVLQRLESESDLMTVVGEVTNPVVLEEAGVDDCDLFVGVAHQETQNLLCCMLAKKLKAKRTLARVQNSDLLEGRYKEYLKELGVDELFCPERIAAKDIANLLTHNVATEYFELVGGLLNMYLVRLADNSPVVGFTLAESMQAYSSLQVRIVAVVRGGHTHIPHADFVFCKGDLAYMVCRPNEMERVSQVAGKNEVDVHSVMIAGGGRVGRFAALSLQHGHKVTVVEDDRKACEQLTDELANCMILNADASDLELLKREGMANVDAFVAVTNSTETNIMVALHAKRLGVPCTVALVENTGFISLSQDIGIDTIINKKQITASYIARRVVKAEGVRVKWLSGTEAEVIELEVSERAMACRKPLGELGMPIGSRVGGVVRRSTTIMPSRTLVLEPGDHVVLFALPDVLEKAVKLFA